MSNYTQFRIEARYNDKVFIVLVKSWFGWRSGFLATDYFSTGYGSLKEALVAIEGYKNRFTEVE